MNYYRLLKDKKFIILLILAGLLYIGFSFTRGAFSKEVKLPSHSKGSEISPAAPGRPEIPEVQRALATSPLVLTGPVPAIPAEE